jgi:hypothetical protein
MCVKVRKTVFTLPVQHGAHQRYCFGDWYWKALGKKRQGGGGVIVIEGVCGGGL